MRMNDMDDMNDLDEDGGFSETEETVGGKGFGDDDENLAADFNWPSKTDVDEDWLTDDEDEVPEAEGSDDSIEISVREKEPARDPVIDPADKTKMELYDWLQCVVSAIICGIFIFVFIGRTIGVEGDSMRNTLHWYDRVIMSNLFYTPKYGDIIIFRAQTNAFGDTPLVKRVIATAGQTVEIDFDTGEVRVDGVVLDEPYIREQTNRKIDYSGPVTVDEGFVFVMGDNRNNSSDSRDARIGLVDTRLILGKVLFLAIPGGDDNDVRDWSRFGLVH